MLDRIDSYELEITSDCNAACPACDRTNFKMPLRGNKNITIEDIKSIFYSKDLIDGVDFLFSGVLGDPIVNPDCYDICKYLTENGAKIVINTNGGYNNVKFWSKMGELDNLCVDFATDGGPDTNHLYRINVKWEVLYRNMKAYSDAGGTGRCVFIEFDHNKQDRDFIENLANELNFKFRTRVNRDKSFTLDKKDIDKKPIKQAEEKEEVTIYDVRNLFKQHKDYAEIINQVSSTIRCRHMKEKSLFIGADMTLWPCCHLYAASLREDFNSHYPDGYNDLKTKTIREIISSNPFTDISDRWDAANDFFLPRCVKTCAQGGFRSRSHSENYKKMAEK